MAWPFRRKPTPPPPPPACEHNWNYLPEGYRMCKACKRLERWDRGTDLQWDWQKASKEDTLAMLKRAEAKDF